MKDQMSAFDFLMFATIIAGVAVITAVLAGCAPYALDLGDGGSVSCIEVPGDGAPALSRPALIDVRAQVVDASLAEQRVIPCAEFLYQLGEDQLVFRLADALTYQWYCEGDGVTADTQVVTFGPAGERGAFLERRGETQDYCFELESGGRASVNLQLHGERQF